MQKTTLTMLLLKLEPSDSWWALEEVIVMIWVTSSSAIVICREISHNLDVTIDARTLLIELCSLRCTHSLDIAARRHDFDLYLYVHVIAMNKSFFVNSSALRVIEYSSTKKLFIYEICVYVESLKRFAAGVAMMKIMYRVLYEQKLTVCHTGINVLKHGSTPSILKCILHSFWALKKLKKKIWTSIFTCYALTKSFYKKSTCHVTCVKMTKFNTKK
jgi:hypothetical protein